MPSAFYHIRDGLGDESQSFREHRPLRMGYNIFQREIKIEKHNEGNAERNRFAPFAIFARICERGRAGQKTAASAEEKGRIRGIIRDK